MVMPGISYVNISKTNLTIQLSKNIALSEGVRGASSSSVFWNAYPGRLNDAVVLNIK